MFYDIFSSSKMKKQKEKIEIIIDYREKNALVASFLESHGFRVTFKQLPVADYLIKDTAVERKTISDLKSSIINKRIFSQMLELKQYPKAILMIEGISSEDLYEGIISENALRGFLLSAALDYQIPLIFTQGEEDSARYIAILANKKENKGPSSIRPSKITLTPEERLQYIIEGFPQIGPITARKLLNRFKTIKGIASASEEDLQKVIGKKAEMVYYLIHYPAFFSEAEDPDN